MIREARPGDLPSLERIQRRSLPEPNPELLRYGIDHEPLVLVSVAGGEPVGYALAIYGEDGAYVAELAVASERRREGRGRLLLSAVVDRLARAGCETASLTVQPGNRVARALYEELGFEETARLDHYYGDGKPAVEMVRTLS